MNFAQMLMAVPQPRKVEKAEPKRGRGCLSPDQMAAWKLKRRQGRNDRWRTAFMELGNECTVHQLAGQLGYTVMGVNSVIKDMRNEDPPCVEKIGERKTGGSGHNQYVYRWIGD